MKKSTMRAAAAMMTAAIALTSFTGCSKLLGQNGGNGNGGSNGGGNIAEKLGVSFAHSYSAEKLDFGTINSIQGFYDFGSKLLISAYDDNYNDIVALYDPTSGSTEPFEFNYMKNLAENIEAYPTSMFMDGQGHLNVLFCAYTWTPSENSYDDEDDSDDEMVLFDEENTEEETTEETAADEETAEEDGQDTEISGEDADSADEIAANEYSEDDDYDGDYYDGMEYKSLPMTLEIYDEDLNVIDSRELDVDEDTSYYRVISNPAGGFLASTWDDSTGNAVLVTLDDNFQKTGKIGGGINYVESIFQGKDGNVYVYYDDTDYNSCLGKVDPASNTLTPIEITGLPNWFNTCFTSHDDKYDFYMSDSDAIYGVKIDGGVCEEAVNWLNSDFNGSLVNNVTQLPDGRFVCTSYNNNNYESCSVWALTERPEDAFKDVTMITMAGVYLPDDLYQAVLEFNRTHDDARIAMANYEKYNTEDNYDGAINQLKNDMTSGIVADLIVTAGLPYESFANKGIFEDLTPYISDLNNETYFMNVFDSLKYGDKLYHIGSSFDVQTLMGKADVVGTKQGLTFDEFMTLCKSLPADTEIFEDMNKSMALDYFVQENLSAFTDLEQHTCTFNSEQFINTLEFCNSFPDDEDSGNKYDNMSDDDWAAYSYRYINGDIAFSNTWINDLKQTYRTEQEYFGEDGAVWVGYPVVEGKGGNGGRISISNTVAMSSNSKVKDKCWEYMSYLLSDDFQNELNWALPVKRSAFEKKVEEAKKPDTYMEDGKEVESPITIWRGEESIEIPNMPQSYADRIKTYIEGITDCTYYDQTIYEIVHEESEKFFTGDQTAQQAADMIQSRASLYLSEQG